MNTTEIITDRRRLAPKPDLTILIDHSFKEPVVKQAMRFAANAHIEQVRKYTGEPYIVHPIAVAKIVQGVTYDDDNMIAAALLHDTVEDTGVTSEDIQYNFGDDIESLVWWLTKPDVIGNRAYRTHCYREHLAKATPRAKTIKLADLIHNTQSIVEHDPKFAVTYLREKDELLKVLKEGNSKLWRQAFELTRISKFRLGMK